MKTILSLLVLFLSLGFFNGCKPKGNEELKDKEHVKMDTVPQDKTKVADSVSNKTRPLGP